MGRAYSTSVTIDGETHCIAEWSRILGITSRVLYHRYHTGQTSPESFKAPPREMHGLSSEYRREWLIWKGIHKRCYNPNSSIYRHYGGRGIKVCDRWHSFSNFLADMGPRPTPKHSVEREDNNGDYCPENCVWLLRKYQNRNKRNSRILTFNGVSQTVADWADQLGVRASMIHSRLNEYGWSVERALSEPPNRRPNKLAGKHAKIIEMYGSGIPVTDIANDLGVCKNSIFGFLDRINVRPRKPRNSA